MIKLFKSRRYDIMEKNKTGKYLKYAIGEIILVIIGILVAIQLNEWRMESNNNIQKQTILNALQLEFEANVEQLDTVIYYMKEIPKAYLLTNKMMRKPIKQYSDSDYSKLILGLGWTHTFNPSNGVLRSAISSSEIHLIENKRLIQILFSWEDVIKDSDEEALTLLKFQYDSHVLKGRYISAAIEWKAIFPEMIPPNNPSDYIGLFQDEAFENFSIRSFAYSQEYLSELNNIKNQNMEILLLIKQELAK